MTKGKKNILSWMKVNKMTLWLPHKRRFKGNIAVLDLSACKAELLAPTDWICRSMCTDVTDTVCCHLCSLGPSVWQAVPGSAAALAARWQTARSRSALQYHRHMCSREYAVDLHTSVQCRPETRAAAAKRFRGVEGLQGGCLSVSVCLLTLVTCK